MSAADESKDKSGWQMLLGRTLDGEVLSESELAPLVAALHDPANRQVAARMLRLESGLRDLGAQRRGFDLALSREKLLAKGALREKSLSLAGLKTPADGPLAWIASRRRVVFASTLAAAAAAFALVVWGGGGPQQPSAQASGDLTITRNGAAVASGTAPMVGDHVVSGPAGGKLVLGDYATVHLGAGTDIVIAGKPHEEAIVLNQGRVTSSIQPGRGQYDVHTPLGTVSVLGTEFVTDVRLAGDAVRSTVVEVKVSRGKVSCALAGETRILTAGQSHVFGEPEQPPQRGRTEAVILSVDDKGVGVKTAEHVFFIESVGHGTSGGTSRGTSNDLMHLHVGDSVVVDWVVHGTDKAVVNVVGQLVGEITAKGEGWIELRPDGERKSRRLRAAWTGGDPSVGGGWDKEMRETIATHRIGDRVVVKWSLSEGARIRSLTPAP